MQYKRQDNIRKTLKLFLLFLTLIHLIGCQSKNDQDMLDSVKAITDTNFLVQKTFKMKPYSLTGYVLQPKTQDQEPTILYSDNKKGLIFLGAIFDENGKPLTEIHKQRYLFPELAKRLLNTATDSNWFLIGSQEAPHQLYFIGEPNCTICHQLYHELKPYIDNKELAIRWIMLSFLKPDSLNKAAAIIQAKDPSAALDLLYNEQEDSTTQNKKTIPATQATQDFINKNLQFAGKNNAVGAPILFFVDQKSRPIRIDGYPGLPIEQLVSLAGAFPNTLDSPKNETIPSETPSPFMQKTPSTSTNMKPENPSL